MLKYPFLKLLLNHADAWALTLMIACVALLMHNAITPQNVLLALMLTIGYWLGFAVNDYFDAPHDAQDTQKAPRNFFVQYRFPKTLTALFFAAFVLLALVVFAPYGVPGMLILILALVVMWAYSAPPLRLKSRPLLDVFSHALFVQTFPYLAMLVLMRASLIAFDFVMLAVFFLASLAAQLEQQTRDFEVDSQTETNFTTTVGRGVAMKLVKIASLLIIALLVSNVVLGTIPLFLLPFGIIGLPTVLHRFARSNNTPRSEKLVFVSVIISLLYMGFIWGTRPM